MGQKCVAVWATDPLTTAGVLGCLDNEVDISAIPSEVDADVLVCVARHLTQPVLAAIRRGAARTTAGIVLVADGVSGADLFGLLDTGVRAVLPRATLDPAQLADAVRIVGAGGAVLPPDVLGALLRETQTLYQEVLAPKGITPSGITRREAEVLRLVAAGWTGVEIGERLGCSDRTVTNVLYGLMSRLNLSNRIHAVAYAVRTGAI